MKEQGPVETPGDASTTITRTFSGYTATRVSVGGIPCEVMDPRIEGDPSYFFVRVPEGSNSLSGVLTWEETQYAMRLALGPTGPSPLTGNASSTGRVEESRIAPEPGDWTISVAPDIAGAAIHWALDLTWLVPAGTTEEETASDVKCATRV